MEKTFATPQRVMVFVHNDVGLTVVAARVGATSHVSLTAEDPGAMELVERATVECRQHAGRDVVVVRVPRPRGMKFIRRNAVTVRADVPPGSDVRVVSASADIELEGSLGQADIKTASGTLRAADVAELRARTASGDVEVETVDGPLRMHSASGDLRCMRADGVVSVATSSGDVEVGAVTGEIEVRATSGDVRLGDVAGDVRITGVSGDVRVLSVTEGQINIRSVSGKIEVGIGRGVTLDVDAESLSGAVHSEIPLGESPRAAHVQPLVGLTLRSVSGDVLITRGLEAFVR
jgi:DUF4097 and DUF4098 domain-containing protein YvlB